MHQNYICAQAPLPQTFSDFWKMVWQYNCPLIVMLTNLTEKNKKKADQYWPEEGETTNYENIFVKHEKTKKHYHDTIILRKFLINKTNQLENEGFKKVIQIHYTGWPDFGVPEKTESMIGLIREVDLRKKELEDPIIVHCSAGIGRTGTFLAIHMALHQQLVKKNSLDLIKKVHIMREQRSGMIQSMDQYKFVYTTLKDLYLQKTNVKNKRKILKHTASDGNIFNKKDPTNEVIKSHFIVHSHTFSTTEKLENI